MDTPKANILYVDDEDNNLQSFNSNFRRIYNVFTAKSGLKALEILQDNSIHVIIADQRMSDMTGVALLLASRKFNPNIIRIMISAYSDIYVYRDAINKLNLFRYLDKPFDKDEIVSAINDGYELFKYREHNDNIIQQLIDANENLSNELEKKLLLTKLLPFQPGGYN